MMKYLLFISGLFMLGACAKKIPQTRVPGDTRCFQTAVPVFSTTLYDAGIDVMGNHVSGLLFVKLMPDSSQRIVFSNETGITFFDFEWTKDGEFRTHYVMAKLKKKVVINTLRNDLELLVIPASIKKTISKVVSSEPPQFMALRNKETLMFKINPDCQSIARVDVMGKNKKMADAVFVSSGKNVPDSVHIAHYNFNMEISLKRIER